MADRFTHIYSLHPGHVRNMGEEINLSLLVFLCLVHFLHVNVMFSQKIKSFCLY